MAAAGLLPFSPLPWRLPPLLLFTFSALASAALSSNYYGYQPAPSENGKHVMNLLAIGPRLGRQTPEARRLRRRLRSAPLTSSPTPPTTPSTPSPAPSVTAPSRPSPFARDMVIRLDNELMVGSFKTIDGRGAQVEVTGGPCITVQGADHVIIHGLSIHDCTPGKPGLVRSSPSHVGHRLGSDGDAISIFASSNVWIDHCRLSHCYDGLIDVTHGSTSVTISNSHFSNHDKVYIYICFYVYVLDHMHAYRLRVMLYSRQSIGDVMLLGHLDTFIADKGMKVTLVFNHFGEGLVQRMPRVRLGYAHVVNNRYEHWEMYAIGGSANPTILSQGNYFDPPSNPFLKQVTKRETDLAWQKWKWRSANDHFLDGAFFVQSGWGSVAPRYTPAQAFTAAQGSMVPFLTADAGPLNCTVPGRAC
ncbi:hypothetical protein Taro_034294 [Colocasia esculenta]|uniref:Pectate lyase n=1 Tax=Colocasia esculenta TaxID=4460 RepID=A0A843VW28_COLES|nr:hypothetical protein [Colocasia esculenta]